MVDKIKKDNERVEGGNTASGWGDKNPSSTKDNNIGNQKWHNPFAEESSGAERILLILHTFFFFWINNPSSADLKDINNYAPTTNLFTFLRVVIILLIICYTLYTIFK